MNEDIRVKDNKNTEILNKETTEGTEQNELKRGISAKIFWFFDKVTYYLGPDLIFLMLLVIVLVVLSIVYGNKKFTPAKKSVMVPLIVFGGLLLFGLLARIKLIFKGSRESLKELGRFTLIMARDWFPLLLIILIYENLHDLTDLIHPETLDGKLRAIDREIFGVDPVLYLEHFVSPALNDYMTFAY